MISIFKNDTVWLNWLNIQSFKKHSVDLVLVSNLLGALMPVRGAKSCFLHTAGKHQAALGSSETLQKGPGKVPVQNYWADLGLDTKDISSKKQSVMLHIWVCTSTSSIEKPCQGQGALKTTHLIIVAASSSFSLVPFCLLTLNQKVSWSRDFKELSSSLKAVPFTFSQLFPDLPGFQKLLCIL